jgi:hypothetical protein
MSDICNINVAGSFISFQIPKYKKIKSWNLLYPPCRSWQDYVAMKADEMIP